LQDVYSIVLFYHLKHLKMEILVILLIGGLAGWLGSVIYQGSGLGLLGNIVVGIIGSFVGYWLLGKLGVSLGTGLLGAIITGAIGAIVVLVILNLIMRGRA
jgi:uncharacterized membrane protein YeaQ/YmgE (transglycosylase-associated protein family)